MNKAQQTTGAQVRGLIVEALEDADGEDIMRGVIDACDGVEADTAACDVDLLVVDPQVQAALKGLISRIVGAFQYAGE